MDRIIERVGDEWTWEIFRTDGGPWYVTAQHHSDEVWKFSESNKHLILAVSSVAMQIFDNGPDWVTSE